MDNRTGGVTMPANLQAYARYRTTSIQTASPERLLIMLYDGLIRFIVGAKVSIESNDLTEVHRQLVKAQDIVLELRSTLKMEYAISHNLAALYDFFTRKLVDANVKKSIEPLDEILPIIQELRETWVQAAMKLKGGEGTEAAE
jgi:flagellar protein FliS